MKTGKDPISGPFFVLNRQGHFNIIFFAFSDLFCCFAGVKKTLHEPTIPDNTNHLYSDFYFFWFFPGITN